MQPDLLNVYPGVGSWAAVHIGPLQCNHQKHLVACFIRDRDGWLQSVPATVQRRLWLMRDGDPAYFSHEVRNHLNITHLVRWIGRGLPAAWPPRSRDLNTLDAFLWCHLENVVHVTPINTQ